ncbi:putative oxidoreductase [Reticulibacter mediterranei]|uniref:Putative oxidoreductase n=1 Tax=Reticulibacter mediterranei TaxID=2778369 RepID=A0A8J3N457_9CHLR|nr:nitroreductase family protein [Reticulibacter mediterranei]GHO95138.1 putative oxidoreductase [Reticulibacter mediterranei]
MSLLPLTPDELLATTRSIRKRLDFSRPVEREVIQECLELAAQAPTGGNNQNWHFVVVTSQRQREALGDIYRKGFAHYQQLILSGRLTTSTSATAPEQVASYRKVRRSSQYLLDNIHRVPVMLIPCIYDRVDGQPSVEQAGTWGSILPATWSFMLAARARGLGTCWTTLHLYYERQAAAILGIPYERVTQAALIPVAYTLGTDFKRASRVPLQSIVHWEQW